MYTHTRSNNAVVLFNVSPTVDFRTSLGRGIMKAKGVAFKYLNRYFDTITVHPTGTADELMDQLSTVLDELVGGWYDTVLVCGIRSWRALGFDDVAYLQGHNERVGSSTVHFTLLPDLGKTDGFAELNPFLQNELRCLLQRIGGKA